MIKGKQLSWKYNLDGQVCNYLGHFFANYNISKSDLRKDMACHWIENIGDLEVSSLGLPNLEKKLIYHQSARK